MSRHKGKNRTAYDIAASILRASEKGAGRTQIMYRANLSFRLLDKYLGMLVESDMLKCQVHEKRAIYYISESGTAFLESYKDVRKMYTKSKNPDRRK